MKNKITFLILSVLSIAKTYSQVDFNPHYTTKYPDNGRYEIICSGIKRADTYKLDRYNGKVFQNVITENKDNIWQEIDIIGHYEGGEKLIVYTTPTYQLFISGITAKDIFLIDTNKGFVWNLVRDTKTEELFFVPITSEKFYYENINLFKKDSL